MTPRFTVDVSLATSAVAMRPGARVRLRVTVQANLDAPNTSVQLIVPALLDYATLEAGRFEPLVSWTTSLRAGERNVREVAVTLPLSRAYSIIAEASHRDDPSAHDRNVQNVVGSRLHLDVRAGGGRVLQAQRAGTYGRAVAFFCEEWMIYCEDDPPPDPPPPPPPSTDDITVTGRLRYRFDGMLQSAPLRRVRVQWTSATGVSGTSRPDENGFFQLACSPSAGGNASLVVGLDHPTDIIITETEFSRTVAVNMTSSCTGPDVTLDWREANVWDNMLKTVDGQRSQLNFSRPRLEVVVTDRFGTAQYRRTSDFVVIDLANVAGARGVFVAGHEFGHALHNRMSVPMPPNACPSPHFLTSPSNAQCAYTEGFASFVSAITSPVNNSEAGNFESDAYRPGCGDAWTCESVVAATLLDLADPINSGDPDGHPDNVALTPRRVLDAVGACTLIYEYRFEYGGETVSSWQYYPHGLSDTQKCLIQDTPKFIGPVGGYELWWANTWMPWSGVTGSVRDAVNARFWR